MQIKAAGFWRRFAALILDGLILGIPVWIISYKFVQPFVFSGDMRTFYLMQLGNMAACVIYSVAFLSSKWQATPGKRIMKVYVARAEDGRRLSVARALARYIALYGVMFAVQLVALHTVPLPKPNMGLTLEQRQQLTVLQQKMMQHQQPTPEEQKQFDTLMQPVMQNMYESMGLTPEEGQRFEAIGQKQKMHQPLTPEDQQLIQKFDSSVAAKGAEGGITALLAFGYALLIVLMIGLTKEKTGPHDLICKTRARRGTPENPILMAVA